MKTLRLSFIALLFVIAGQTLGAQTLIGTWEWSRTNNDGTVETKVLTFNEDGTFARDAQTPYPGRHKQTYTVTSHVEGQWKLLAKGKRISMRIYPATVTVDYPEGAEVIGKLVKAALKTDVGPNIPKIDSLTEDTLVLLEVVEDEVKGPDAVDSSHSEYFTYKKQNIFNIL